MFHSVSLFSQAPLVRGTRALPSVMLIRCDCSTISLSDILPTAQRESYDIVPWGLLLKLDRRVVLIIRPHMCWGKKISRLFNKMQ